MSLPINPQALLLDFDGTLTDSLAGMYQAYRQFLEQFGRDPSESEFDLLNGPPLLEIVRYLKVSHDLEGEEKTLLSNYLDLIDQVYLDVKPRVGAFDLLQAARDHHCTIVIVTSNSRKLTQSWLEKVFFSSMIDFIVSGDEVKQGKPHPEPYRIAFQHTLCKPSKIVVIEDSPKGAKSAVDAGLRTFVLNYERSLSWPQGIEPISSLNHAAEKLWK